MTRKIGLELPLNEVAEIEISDVGIKTVRVGRCREIDLPLPIDRTSVKDTAVERVEVEITRTIAKINRKVVKIEYDEIPAEID